MRLSGKTTVDTRGFGRYRRLVVDRAVPGALREIGGRVAASASSAPSPYRTQAIQHSETSAVFRTRRGQAIDVTAKDRRAILFERGTYRKGRGSGEGNKGVKPLRFLRNSLRKHRDELVPALERRLP